MSNIVATPIHVASVGAGTLRFFKSPSVAQTSWQATTTGRRDSALRGTLGGNFAKS